MEEFTQHLLKVINSNQEIRLYQYRINQDDYDSLKNYLSSQNKQLIDNTYHKRSFSKIDKLFVLYGAEWFRREYIGDWRWQDLLQSIGLDTDNFTNQSLVSLVESGLKKWGRKIHRNVASNHRNALGSLMREGGLPIAYFNSSGGWLGRLLEGALETISKKENYENYLRDYSHLIPKSSSRDDIIFVLIELTEDIYQLVEVHSLHEKEDPVSYLDVHVTDWKESFPFPLEARSAHELLSNLILKSSRQVKENNKYNSRPSIQPKILPWQKAIHLQRIIQVDKKSKNISLEAKINRFKELNLGTDNLKEVTVDSLSLAFYMQSTNSSTTETQLGIWNGYPIYNQELLKFRQAITFTMPEEHWCSGLYMKIETPTGDLLNFTDSNGLSLNPYQNASMYSIDEHIPFLANIQMEDEDLGTIVAEYIGSNSQKTKQQSALIYIPDSYHFDENAHLDSKVEFIGEILRGNLYKLTGTITLTNTSINEPNTSFHFITNCQDANFVYEIRGKQLADFIYPTMTFKSGFQIYKTNIDSLVETRVSEDTIFIKPFHSPLYKNLSSIDRSSLAGIYQILVKSSNGNIVFQQVLGLLPNDFRYKLIPQKSTKFLSSGKIVFEDIEPNSLISDDKSVQIEKVAEKKSEFILFTQSNVPVNKMTLALSLQNQSIDSNKAMHFRCYFPTSQTLIYDAQDNIIPINSLLNVNASLYGYRIKIYNAERDRLVDLSFYLASDDDIKITLPMRLKRNEFTILEPHNWQAIIRKLLSFSRSKRCLDDSVIVEYSSNTSNAGFKLRFGYYNYEFDIKSQVLELKLHHSLLGTQNFDNPKLENMRDRIRLTAINFATPDAPAISLIPQNHQWHLQPLDGLSSQFDDATYRGTWLIFPDVISTAMNVNMMDNHSLEGTFPSVRAIAYTPEFQLESQLNYHQRRALIKSELKQMSIDVNHIGWEYLKNLSKATMQLPSISLDQWERARSVPDFMLTFAIFGKDLLGLDVYDKVMSELGYHWELTNIQHFSNTWANYRVFSQQQLAQHFSGEQLETILTTKLDSIQKDLEQIAGLNSYFQAIKPLEVSLRIDLFKALLNSKFTPMAAVMQNQEIHWPQTEALNSIIEEIYKLIPINIKLSIHFIENHHYMRSVALLPIALAWVATQNLTGLQKKLRKQSLAIYQIQNFDRHWFDECFHLSLMWFYHNINNIQQ